MVKRLKKRLCAQLDGGWKGGCDLMRYCSRLIANCNDTKMELEARFLGVERLELSQSEIISYGQRVGEAAVASK